MHVNHWQTKPGLRFESEVSRSRGRLVSKSPASYDHPLPTKKADGGENNDSVLFARQAVIEIVAGEDYCVRAMMALRSGKATRTNIQNDSQPLMLWLRYLGKSEKRRSRQSNKMARAPQPRAKPAERIASLELRSLATYARE